MMMAMPMLTAVPLRERLSAKADSNYRHDEGDQRKRNSGRAERTVRTWRDASQKALAVEIEGRRAGEDIVVRVEKPAVV